MTTSKENLDNPGIFVRLFGDDNFECLWLDGHKIIEIANNEESTTGEDITAYLAKKGVDYAREIYSPLGEFEGTSVIRHLTLHEAVHYLGRRAKICAFLRPKAQAARFAAGLFKGEEIIERKVADNITQLIKQFEDMPVADSVSQSGIYRAMESQLLRISMGTS